VISVVFELSFVMSGLIGLYCGSCAEVQMLPSGAFFND